MTQPPEVLFVCAHNAGRSQMAAALLAHHAEGTARVTSAGSTPAEEINPQVRAAMSGLGIDLSGEFPRRPTTDAVQAAEVVITMGRGDACPVFPGKRYLDWELPDPSSRALDEIRPIREEISQRVMALLADLDPTRSAGRSGSSGGHCPGQTVSRSRSFQYRARTSFFRILPVGLRGSSSTTSTDFGHL